MNLLRFFLRALAEGGVVVCALLAAIEWLLPGSVLPYAPLPALAMGVMALCLFTRGQGSFLGSMVVTVLLVGLVALMGAILVGDGWHALAVLGALGLACGLIALHAYEKHPAVS